MIKISPKYNVGDPIIHNKHGKGIITSIQYSGEIFKETYDIDIQYYLELKNHVPCFCTENNLTPCK